MAHLEFLVVHSEFHKSSYWTCPWVHWTMCNTVSTSCSWGVIKQRGILKFFLKMVHGSEKVENHRFRPKRMVLEIIKKAYRRRYGRKFEPWNLHQLCLIQMAYWAKHCHYLNQGHTLNDILMTAARLMAYVDLSKLILLKLMYWKRSNPNCNGNRCDKVALKTTCIKNVEFKIIKITTGSQYVGYF